MKICQYNACPNPVFSKGFCQWHYKKTPLAKPKKRIAHISHKHRKELQEYKIVRAEYLTEHPLCEANLEGCTKEATEIHHKKGRIGSLLIDPQYFLSSCHNCHVIIENNPEMAKELGLSQTRIKELTIKNE